MIEMKIYCDGSRVGLNKGEPVIGWAAVCKWGVVAFGSQRGGSNINAEMTAIRDCLRNVFTYRVSWCKQWSTSGEKLEVVTDSLTSVQIITGFLRDPWSYDLQESLNYRLAQEICQWIGKLRDSRGVSVTFKHVRGHGRDESMTDEDVLGNAFADYVATQEAQNLQSTLDGAC